MNHEEECSVMIEEEQTLLNLLIQYSTSTTTTDEEDEENIQEEEFTTTSSITTITYNVSQSNLQCIFNKNNLRKTLFILNNHDNICEVIASSTQLKGVKVLASFLIQASDDYIQSYPSFERLTSVLFDIDTSLSVVHCYLTLWNCLCSEIEKALQYPTTTTNQLTARFFKYMNNQSTAKLICKLFERLVNLQQSEQVLKCLNRLESIVDHLSNCIQTTGLTPYCLSSNFLHQLTQYVISQDSYLIIEYHCIQKCLEVCEKKDMIRCLLCVKLLKQLVDQLPHSLSVILWILELPVTSDNTELKLMKRRRQISEEITTLSNQSEHQTILHRIVNVYLPPLVERMEDDPVLLLLLETINNIQQSLPNNTSQEFSCDDQLDTIDKVVRILQHHQVEFNLLTHVNEMLDVCVFKLTRRRLSVTAKQSTRLASILSEKFKPTIKRIEGSTMIWNSIRFLFQKILKPIVTRNEQLSTIIINTYYGLTTIENYGKRSQRIQFLLHVIRHLPDELFYQFEYFTIEQVKSLLSFCNEMIENEIQKVSTVHTPILKNLSFTMNTMIDCISTIHRRNSTCTFLKNPSPFYNSHLTRLFHNNGVTLDEQQQRERICQFILSHHSKTIYHVLFKRIPIVFDLNIKKIIFKIQTGRVGGTIPSKDVMIMKRNQLITSAYQNIMSRKRSDLQMKAWKIQFEGEKALDINGVRREFVTLLSRELFSTSNNTHTTIDTDNSRLQLWNCSSEDHSYYPMHSATGNNHLQLFEFCGRFMAKCLIENELIDTHFSKFVYKKLLGKKLSYHDLKSVDSVYNNQLLWVRDNDITDVLVDQTFTIDTPVITTTNTTQQQQQPLFTQPSQQQQQQNLEEEDTIFEEMEHLPPDDEKTCTKTSTTTTSTTTTIQLMEVELCNNGKRRQVTNENKIEYLDLLVDYKLNREMEEQFRMIMKGFNDLIDMRNIQIFDELELELFMCGMESIDLNDMKTHVKYTYGYSDQSETIIHFWKILNTLSNEQVSMVLQFITGSPRVCMEGFQSKPITIQRIPDINKLPSASTCFNLLKLPDYQNEQLLRDKLLFVLSEGLTGFAYS